MSIKIVADAGSNLFPEILKAKGLDIRVACMHLTIKDQDFLCYEKDFDTPKVSKLLYEELAGDVNVHTSLVGPHDFYQIFKKDVDAGHQVICFTMAKGISGTYQSACLARDMINEETKKEMVYVCDSATAGFGEGLQAIHAHELAASGKSFKEICEEIEKFKFKVRSEFTVDDIGFLARTGRVSKTVARIAKMLRIKVLLKGSDESYIVQTSKVSGRRLALKRLTKQCVDYIRHPENQIVYITHCNCLKDAEAMKASLAKEGIKNVEIYDYDLVTASHIGPNSMAIFYVGDNRSFTNIFGKEKKEKKPIK